MTQKRKSLLEIHSAVFLFGLAGLFPKLIHLPPVVIIPAGATVAMITLGIILYGSGKTIKLYRSRDYLVFVLLGVLFSLDAVGFYQSIQVSTVAIGVLSAGIFPIFVALLEPLYFREKIHLREVLVAFITFGGLCLIVPRLDFHLAMMRGVCWGIVSGFAFANLSILNRKYVQQYSSLLIAFYENLFASLLLFPILLITKVTPQLRDVSLIVLSGIAFAAGGQMLFVRGMKTMKAHTASMVANLQPIYGIVFASILLAEIPTLKMIAGGLIILAATFYVTLSARNSVT